MGHAKTLLGIFALLLFLNTETVAREIQWFKGTVIFNNDESLHAEMHLNQELGLLMVKSDEHIRTFPAFKFKYVEYFDTEYGEPRYFMSIFKRKTPSISEHSVFEIVVFGRYLVLRKELPSFGQLTEPFSNTLEKDEYEKVENFIYYVYDGDRMLKLQHVNRRKMKMLTQRYDRDIEQYIQKNQIHYRDSYSKIKVLAYYNALAQRNAKGDDS